MPLDPRERNLTDPGESFRAAFDGLKASIWTNMAVQVVEDSDGKTVKLKMTIKGQTRDEKGKLKEVEYPLLADVPVHFPGGGGDDKTSVVLTHPIKKTDEGTAIFMSRPIDNWFEKGGVQGAVDLRTHHLSDAVFKPGLRAKPRELKNISTGSAQLRSVNGKNTVDHHPDNGTWIKSVDPDDKADNPFNDAKKFYEFMNHPKNGIANNATDNDTTHSAKITHKDGVALSAKNNAHTATVHPDNGAAISAENGAHKVEAKPGAGVAITSSVKHSITAPDTSVSGTMNVSGLLTAAQASIGSISGLMGGGGGASSGVGAGAMQTGASATNVGNLGGDLAGMLPNPTVIGLTHITNANLLPVAANNAAAATAGVLVGGLYRLGGNPDQVCVRNA